MFIVNLLSIIEHIIHKWGYLNLGDFYTNSKIISGVGLSLVIMGQFIRSLSMYTAKSSFNHYIQKKRRLQHPTTGSSLEHIDNTSDNDDQDDDVDSHKLITTGIYLIFRHPSYFGFFIWF